MRQSLLPHPPSSRHRSCSTTVDDRAALKKQPLPGDRDLDSYLTLSFAQRLKARIRCGASRASNIVLRTSQRILTYAALATLVLIASVHSITTLRYMSLPAFCRQPGMDIYLDTKHCSPLYSRAPLPDAHPFRGSPPQPIYWADFQGLYSLESRMAEHIFEVFTFANATIHKSVSGKNDGEFSLDLLATEVCRTSRRKCAEVHHTIDMAKDVKGRLGHASQNTSLMVEALVNSNQRVAREVEQAYDKQPKTIPQQIASRLLPRFRRAPWTWDMDVELRWQYRRALTDFATGLHQQIALLTELVPEIRKFNQALDDLQLLLEDQRDGEEELDASDSDAAGRNWLETLERASMLDGLAEDSQAVVTRLEEALETLGVINREFEDIVHKVASPVSRIPFHVHFKHIYVAGFRLRKSLEKMGKL